MSGDPDQTLYQPEGADGIETMGPIQLMSIAFNGNHFKGEILPELERLKREGIVRIVDMLFVRRDSLGNVMVTTASDLDWEEAVSFGSFVGALAGFAADGPAGIDRGAIAGAAELADGHLFNEDDLFRVTQVLPKNMSAALVIFEHLWSKPLLEAVANAGGTALTNDWLSVEKIFAAAHKTGIPDDLA
jgi:uncharacterized membrane protein